MGFLDKNERVIMIGITLCVLALLAMRTVFAVPDNLLSREITAQLFDETTTQAVVPETRADYSACHNLMLSHTTIANGDLAVAAEALAQSADCDRPLLRARQQGEIAWQSQAEADAIESWNEIPTSDLLEWGRITYGSGDIERADAIYAAVESRIGDEPVPVQTRFYEIRGEYYYIQRDWERAASMLEKGFALDSELSRTARFLAEVYRRDARFDDAFRVLESAEINVDQLDPYTAVVYYIEWGQGHAENADPSAASDRLDQAVQRIELGRNRLTNAHIETLTTRIETVRNTLNE